MPKQDVWLCQALCSPRGPKAKTSNLLFLQCTNQNKNGKEFCGVHSKMAKLLYGTVASPKGEALQRMQDRLQATTGDKLQVVPSMNDFLGKVLKAYGKDSSKKDPSVVGKFALHLHLHAFASCKAQRVRR